MYIYIDIQKEKEQSLVLVWSSKNIIIQKNVLPQKRWKPLEVQRCTKVFFLSINAMSMPFRV